MSHFQNRILDCSSQTPSFLDHPHVSKGRRLVFSLSKPETGDRTVLSPCPSPCMFRPSGCPICCTSSMGVKSAPFLHLCNLQCSSRIITSVPGHQSGIYHLIRSQSLSNPCSTRQPSKVNLIVSCPTSAQDTLLRGRHRINTSLWSKGALCALTSSSGIV